MPSFPLIGVMQDMPMPFVRPFTLASTSRMAARQMVARAVENCPGTPALLESEASMDGARSSTGTPFCSRTQR
jgi:hypothetical protein